ncbi:MAG: DUF1501 domain-containing protein [Bryobacteraceae bacterium]|jgi:uncharacterized protein (DUF1501 family)
MLTRRIFLRGSAVVMAGMGAAPLWLTRAAAAGSRKNKTLVAIFLRGAADGLNIVVPFGDKRYRELRPSLAVAPPSLQNNGNGGPFGPAIDLDGTFALHSGLQPLKALWDKKQLAIVEATGSPDPTRSHFDAQDYMESGTPGKSVAGGWLNRALPAAAAGASPLRAVALGNRVPRTLRGEHEVIAIGNAQQFKIGDEATASILRNMYSLSPDAPFRRTGTDAFEAMKMIASIGVGAPPAPEAEGGLGGPGVPRYAQGGELGRGLQELARLIKGEAGVEAAFAEIGGWDHHGNENQQLANLLRQFSNAIAAFCQDMGDRMEDIVLVTMSEFGRTVEENGDAGTDHGHGSMMMVLGGAVQGGKIYGEWPGLEKEQLYEGRDLAVTTDFRAVLSELVRGHLGQNDLSTVFPGFQPGAPLGLLRS